MKKPTTWVIVALSVIVLVQTIIIFRVWPAEYYYTKMGQLPVRIRQGDQKTEYWNRFDGWQEAKPTKKLSEIIPEGSEQ